MRGVEIEIVSALHHPQGPVGEGAAGIGAVQRCRSEALPASAVAHNPEYLGAVVFLRVVLTVNQKIAVRSLVKATEEGKLR